jgi:hypothetical protein
MPGETVTTMNAHDRVRLLFGPYKPPKLRRGRRAFCLYRDADVIITGWSAGRIRWPRCRTLDDYGGGGSGLLVDERLAYAIRHESAAAILYWWGVTCSTVARWRKALGVSRMDSEGSQRLILAASAAGAHILRGQKLPPEACEQRRRMNAALNLKRHLRPGYHGLWWTAEDLALLGTMPDELVAAYVGRTTQAVRCRRTELGIASACNRRRRGNRYGGAVGARNTAASTRP